MEPIVMPFVNAARPADMAVRAALRNDRASGPSLEKTAKDFEAVLLGRMLEEMKKTVGSGGLTEDAASEQVLDVAWSGLAQDLADKGGLGLWKDIVRQMDRAGGAAADATSPSASVDASR
jgi:Rod binding domain-containing protein